MAGGDGKTSPLNPLPLLPLPVSHFSMAAASGNRAPLVSARRLRQKRVPTLAFSLHHSHTKDSFIPSADL